MSKAFSLDDRVYKSNQDFSLSYRELLNIIKSFNDSDTNPTKREIINKKFGGSYVEKNWVSKKIGEMLKTLIWNKYIKVLPLVNEQGNDIIGIAYKVISE